MEFSVMAKRNRVLLEFLFGLEAGIGLELGQPRGSADA
jgi:hypothetical protein